MKIIFFGLGSIGTRHARLIKEMFPDFKLYAFRIDPRKTNDLGITQLSSWEELDQIDPDIAFITNPTAFHLEYAIKCAERGMNLFIEKPLSDSDELLSKFIRAVRKHNIQTYVAYHLRFHPVIEKLKELIEPLHVYHATIYSSSYLPSWRPQSNHKQSYSAQKSLGGGALLDLSHEIDYLLYLFNKPSKVLGINGRASDITVDSEDFADVIFVYPEKQVFLHLDFFSRMQRREIIIDSDEKTICADLLSGIIEIHDEAGTQQVRCFYEKDEIYKKQLVYFFGGIKRKQKMMNSLDESIDSFRFILDVQKKTMVKK